MWRSLLFTRTVPSQTPTAEAETAGDIELGKYSCCCKHGPCRDTALGSRGLSAKTHALPNGSWICCKERGTRCTTGYHLLRDASLCVPAEDPGRTRICYSQYSKLHMNIEFGDGGCLGLLTNDGAFTDPIAMNTATYAARDCPFAGNSEDDHVRRQLLFFCQKSKPNAIPETELDWYRSSMHLCSMVLSVSIQADNVGLFC